MEYIAVWILSIQLWTDPPPKIQLIYSKEYATHEECMQEREKWVRTKFVSLCLIKSKPVESSVKQ